jgi:hypothetical protein
MGEGGIQSAGCKDLAEGGGKTVEDNLLGLRLSFKHPLRVWFLVKGLFRWVVINRNFSLFQYVTDRKCVWSIY